MAPDVDPGRPVGEADMPGSLVGVLAGDDADAPRLVAVVAALDAGGPPVRAAPMSRRPATSAAGEAELASLLARHVAELDERVGTPADRPAGP